MTGAEAVVLGVVEGLTEFLPVSSTGHLTIAEQALGLPVDDVGVTAFTAIVQLGAIAATLLYFRDDVRRLVVAFVHGLTTPQARSTADYRMAWAVIAGTVPIAIVGLLFKDQIETTLRSLWFVVIGLLGWSAVMAFADERASQRRHEESITWRDTVAIGVVQCVALVPGVSRAGATMSAGLLRGLDRTAATRLSFFLAIPALLAAGLLEAATKAGDVSRAVGWGPTAVATLVSFLVAYAAIAWLLRFVTRHSYAGFVVYRCLLAIVLAVLLTTGTLAAR